MPDDTHLQPFADRVKAAEAARCAPTDVGLQLDLAEAQDALGGALLAGNDVDRARFFYWEAFMARIAVMRERADNPVCEMHFSVSLDKLGALLIRLGDLQKADELLVEALERRRRLAQHFDDLASHHLLVVSLVRKAVLERARSRPGAEAVLLDEAKEALARLVERWPDRPFLERDQAAAAARLRQLGSHRTAPTR